MLQYKIPQNVQVEDTIIGPITMRQLIILGVGGGAAYMIYIYLEKTYLFETWGPPVILISLLTVCVAFVKVRGITFVRWVLLMIESLMLPRQRVWDKRQSVRFLWQYTLSGGSNTLAEKNEKNAGKKNSLQKKEEQVDKLEEISKNLDISNIFRK
jgi:hypothetical protein